MRNGLPILVICLACAETLTAILIVALLKP
jgi:hypothetical protein